eukprot:1160071-Pelagomonas_calceolata.AAC.20
MFSCLGTECKDNAHAFCSPERTISMLQAVYAKTEGQALRFKKGNPTPSKSRVHKGKVPKLAS